MAFRSPSSPNRWGKKVTSITTSSTGQEYRSCKLTDLEDESLKFRSSLSLMPLVSVQWVHEPCDHLCGEDGGVCLVEVLEITQSIQSPWTQCVDETTQEVESTEGKLLLNLKYLQSKPALTSTNWNDDTVISMTGLFHKRWEKKNTWPAELGLHFGQRRWPCRAVGSAHCNNFGRSGQTELLGNQGV